MVFFLSFFPSGEPVLDGLPPDQLQKRHTGPDVKNQDKAKNTIQEGGCGSAVVGKLRPSRRGTTTTVYPSLPNQLGRIPC